MPRFVPRPLPSVAAALGLGAALALGSWQLDRDVERNEGRERALAVAGLPVLTSLEGDVAWRCVVLQGSFEGPALLEAGVRRGERVGYGVWMAFDAPGGTVLVDRGWVPADDVEAEVARLPAPTRVEGQARPGWGSAEGRPVGSTGSLEIWRRGATAAMAASTRASWILVDPPEPDGVPPRDDTSFHYALQWFGIGLAVVVTWVIASARSPGRPA